MATQFQIRFLKKATTSWQSLPIYTLLNYFHLLDFQLLLEQTWIKDTLSIPLHWTVQSTFFVQLFEKLIFSIKGCVCCSFQWKKSLVSQLDHHIWSEMEQKIMHVVFAKIIRQLEIFIYSCTFTMNVICGALDMARRKKTSILTFKRNSSRESHHSLEL